MSDKASDTCLHNCSPRMAVKRLYEYFPASSPKDAPVCSFRQQGHALFEQEGNSDIVSLNA